ncbi:hypothetical protein ACLKA6_019239 [Drosophila palustris]
MQQAPKLKYSYLQAEPKNDVKGYEDMRKKKGKICDTIPNNESVNDAKIMESKSAGHYTTSTSKAGSL